MRRLLVLAAFAATACDPIWDIELEIMADPPAHAATGEYPQAIFFHLESERSAYVAAVLCGPGDAAFVAFTRTVGLGCGTADTLTAWLQEKPDDVDLPCGSQPSARFAGSDRAPPGDAWRASVPVFQSGRCPRHERVALTLAPPQ
jgi:hypothetical protein